jgi:hypothetical protein
MSGQPTHINIFPFNPRVDKTGMVAFVASALAFSLLQLKPARGGSKGKRSFRVVEPGFLVEFSSEFSGGQNTSGMDHACYILSNPKG